MVYLLKMVIFHGELLNNQMVYSNERNLQKPRFTKNKYGFDMIWLFVSIRTNRNDKESLSTLSTKAQSGNSVHGERLLQGYEIVATPGCWTKAARCFLADRLSPSVPLHISPLRLGEAFVSHAWDGAFVAFAQAVFQASLASLFHIGKKLKPLVCFRSQLCSRLFSAVRFKLHARCFKPGNRRQISGFHSWSGAQRAQHLSVLRPKHFRALFWFLLIHYDSFFLFHGMSFLSFSCSQTCWRSLLEIRKKIRRKGSCTSCEPLQYVAVYIYIVCMYVFMFASYLFISKLYDI
jgi:hypothetical protein